MSSSARAYVSGYADGLYQNHQHIPGAAPRIRYLMKNVSSVPRLMSSRCCFALNGRTHNLDRQLTDFIECINCYQMVDFACCAILLFSYNEFACPSHQPLQHSSNRCWVSHTSNCPLQKSSQQGLWLSRHGQVGLSWPSDSTVSSGCGRQCCAVVSLPRCEKLHLRRPSLARFVGCILRTGLLSSHNQNNWWLLQKCVV